MRISRMWTINLHGKLLNCCCSNPYSTKLLMGYSIHRLRGSLEKNSYREKLKLLCKSLNLCPFQRNFQLCTNKYWSSPEIYSMIGYKRKFQTTNVYWKPLNNKIPSKPSVPLVPMRTLSSTSLTPHVRLLILFYFFVSFCFDRLLRDLDSFWILSLNRVLSPVKGIRRWVRRRGGRRRRRKVAPVAKRVI